MKRRSFLKNTLSVLPTIVLPTLLKADDSTSYTYQGEYIRNGQEIEVHVHFQFDPKIVQKSHEGKKLYICVVEEGQTRKYPFIIKSSGGTKKFGNLNEPLFYITAEYQEYNSDIKFNPSDSFILIKNKEARIGFSVENSKYWQAPIDTKKVFIMNKAEESIALPYVPDDSDDLDCFLTSACVGYKGLSDDCYELTQLRQLRDNYMAGRDEYKPLLAEYKIIGPQMLKHIYSAKNKDEVLSCIYDQLVLPSINYIELGEKRCAVEYYTHFVKEMKKAYL